MTSPRPLSKYIILCILLFTRSINQVALHWCKVWPNIFAAICSPLVSHTSFKTTYSCTFQCTCLLCQDSVHCLCTVQSWQEFTVIWLISKDMFPSHIIPQLIVSSSRRWSSIVYCTQYLALRPNRNAIPSGVLLFEHRLWQSTQWVWQLGRYARPCLHSSLWYFPMYFEWIRQESMI
jgi:hypothetical protein